MVWQGTGQVSAEAKARTVEEVLSGLEFREEVDQRVASTAEDKATGKKTANRGDGVEIKF